MFGGRPLTVPKTEGCGEQLFKSTIVAGSAKVLAKTRIESTKMMLIQSKSFDWMRGRKLPVRKPEEIMQWSSGSISLSLIVRLFLDRQ